VDTNYVSSSKNLEFDLAWVVSGREVTYHEARQIIGFQDQVEYDWHLKDLAIGSRQYSRNERHVDVLSDNSIAFWHVLQTENPELVVIPSTLTPATLSIALVCAYESLPFIILDVGDDTNKARMATGEVSGTIRTNEDKEQHFGRSFVAALLRDLSAESTHVSNSQPAISHWHELEAALARILFKESRVLPLYKTNWL